MTRDRATLEARPVPEPRSPGSILDDRARHLARVPERVPDAAEVLEVATFSLGTEDYAIETRFVRRIMRSPGWTPVPGTPPILAGLTNSEGEVLAVFDVRILFGRGPTPEAGTDQARLIVLGVDREEFAILADAVHEVRPLRIDAVFASSTPLEGGARHPVVRGLTADAVIVIDGASLLRDERLVIDQHEDLGP